MQYVMWPRRDGPRCRDSWSGMCVDVGGIHVGAKPQVAKRVTVSTPVQRGIGCHLEDQLRAHFRDRDTGGFPKDASADFIGPG